MAMASSVNEVLSLDVSSRPNPVLVHKPSEPDVVRGVAVLDDRIFVIYDKPVAVNVFGPNFEQLKPIWILGLSLPIDIVACSETGSLYIADWAEGDSCVWRGSMYDSTDDEDDEDDENMSDSTDISDSTELFQCINLHDAFDGEFDTEPRSLSVRSGRLLVTTSDQLLYDADGSREPLSFDDMFDLKHAVETSRGTIVLCHLKPRPQVVEVDHQCRIMYVYKDEHKLVMPCYLSLNSEDKIFIAERGNHQHRILSMTINPQLVRVLLDEKHDALVKNPGRLCYVQQTSQLIVASELVVRAFDLDSTSNPANTVCY